MLRWLKSDGALRVCLWYALFSGIWILTSDWLLSKLFNDPVIIARISVGKGWAFVLTTATLLYFTLRREFNHRQQVEAEIRRLNAELEQRVRDRTIQLKAANEEMEAFAYSASHDLRVPLRSLNGFSQILLEDYGEKFDEQGQRYLKIIHQSSIQMGHLIDALLQLSRLSRSEMKISQVDMSALAHEIADDLQKTEPERRVEWRLGSGLQVTGDADQMRIVLVNLLQNAWKFTRQSDTAQIEFLRVVVGGQNAFVVRDNGAGFDPSQTGRLFIPFQRLHASKDFEGTGVGLALVQRVIRRHGGEVWAEGKEGAGAAFYFTLPG